MAELRKFGLLEKYQAAKALTRTYGSVTFAVELGHPPRSDAQDAESFFLDMLHAPLVAVIQQHPMLRVTAIDSDKPTARFVQVPQFDLKDICTFTAVESLDAIEDVIRAEICLDFDLNRSDIPLWRLHVCYTPSQRDRCCIVFAMQHVIMDGKSLAIFWTSLLKELNTDRNAADTAEMQQYLIETGTPSPLPLPYEDRNAPAASFLDLCKTLAGMVNKKILPYALARKIYPEIDGWQGDYPNVKDFSKLQHCSHVRLLEFGGQDWLKLCKEAKQTHNISPHAVIMASLLLAYKDVYPGRTVTTSTPVNCRRYCNPPLSEDEIGNFVGAAAGIWKPNKLSYPFWELAKAYSKKLAKTRSETAKQASQLRYLKKYPEEYVDFLKGYLKRYKFGRQGGIELSDLGLFRSPSQEGPYTVQKTWFCQSACTVMPAINASAASTTESMFVTLTWQEGSIEESNINAFVERFYAHLRQAAEAL